MNKPAQDAELLYQGQWLRLVRRGHWESCERTHGRDGLAVLVIAVTPDDEVLFVCAESSEDELDQLLAPKPPKD